MNGISDYRRLLLQRHQQPLADATVMLGGGGARGLAHLGALRALGHSGIGVQRLVGVSMGALMAAMCAAERDVERVEMLARDFLESDRYRSLQQRVMGKAAGAPRSGSDDTSWTRRFRDLLWTTKAFGRAVASESLIPSTILEGIVDALLPDIDIEDLRKPLFLIAVDLQSGERVVLSRGSLRRAVVASMSIPGVFPAVEIDGRRLSDVGVYDAVPCDVARELMRLDRPEEAVASDASELGELIVVDVSLTKSDAVVCETALQSMLRVQELAEIRIRERQLELADVVVRPDVGEVPWYDFTQPEPLINAGYDAVKRALREKETGSMNPANPTSIAGSFVHSNPAPQP
ncbi:MAG: patatin-like phospholipase family protein [Planctomycetota bacterium]